MKYYKDSKGNLYKTSDNVNYTRFSVISKIANIEYNIIISEELIEINNEEFVNLMVEIL